MAAKNLVDVETGEVFITKPELDRSKENKDFVMMYRRFIAQIADLGMQDAQALRILLFLAKHMDHRNALAVPVNLMAEMLQVSRQTISTKIKYLEDNGWICVYKLGRQNVYVINPDVFWTAYADERSYCEFDAKVMLSYEDNWAIVKRNDKKSIKHIDRDVLKELAEREFPEQPQQN